MRDMHTAAELENDGPTPEPYMREALDTMVWRIMSGEERTPFALVDFLAEQTDLHEEVADAMQGVSTWRSFEIAIESRLRKALEDHDSVVELAGELANEEQT